MPPIGITFGWSEAGIWIAAIGVIGLLVRQVVPWLKQTNDADAKLRDLLMQRVQKLEERLEKQERRHSAEQRHSNHKFRNVTACFDSILTMLKLMPDRVPEIVEEIEAMRARQQLAEAEEMKALHFFELADPEMAAPE